MLCSNLFFKSRSHSHDFNADFPRQIVGVLVVVNREHLPTIRSFHEYLQPFCSEATSIEDIHMIMELEFARSTTFYGLERSCYESAWSELR